MAGPAEKIRRKPNAGIRNLTFREVEKRPESRTTSVYDDPLRARVPNSSMLAMNDLRSPSSEEPNPLVPESPTDRTADVGETDIKDALDTTAPVSEENGVKEVMDAITPKLEDAASDDFEMIDKPKARTAPKETETENFSLIDKPKAQAAPEAPASSDWYKSGEETTNGGDAPQKETVQALDEATKDEAAAVLDKAVPEIEETAQKESASTETTAPEKTQDTDKAPATEAPKKEEEKKGRFGRFLSFVKKTAYNVGNAVYRKVRSFVHEQGRGFEDLAIRSDAFAKANKMTKFLWGLKHMGSLVAYGLAHIGGKGTLNRYRDKKNTQKAWEDEKIKRYRQEHEDKVSRVKKFNFMGPAEPVSLPIKNTEAQKADTPAASLPIQATAAETAGNAEPAPEPKEISIADAIAQAKSDAASPGLSPGAPEMPNPAEDPSPRFAGKHGKQVGIGLATTLANVGAALTTVSNVATNITQQSVNLGTAGGLAESKMNNFSGAASSMGATTNLINLVAQADLRSQAKASGNRSVKNEATVMLVTEGASLVNNTVASVGKFLAATSAGAGIVVAAPFVSGIISGITAIKDFTKVKAEGSVVSEMDKLITPLTASGKILEKAESDLLNAYRQVQQVSKIRKTQAAFNTAGSTIQAAGSGLSGVLLATGVGAAAGAAVGVVGLATKVAGDLNADTEMKEARNDIVEQEYGVDAAAKEYYKEQRAIRQGEGEGDSAGDQTPGAVKPAAGPEMSEKAAKHIVIKALGFESGKRKEIWQHLTMFRAKDLADRANSEPVDTGGSFSSILSGMGLDRVEGKFSLQGVAEKLGFEPGKAWQKQMDEVRMSRGADRFADMDELYERERKAETKRADERYKALQEKKKKTENDLAAAPNAAPPAITG
jgi:hypothetical protein